MTGLRVEGRSGRVRGMGGEAAALVEAARQRVCDRVDELADVLVATSHAIHAEPELAFEEHRAHELLTEVLADNGVDVIRSAYDLDTAFEGSAGTEGPVVAVLCEYDALPGIATRADTTSSRLPGWVPAWPRQPWPTNSVDGSESLEPRPRREAGAKS